MKKEKEENKIKNKNKKIKKPININFTIIAIILIIIFCISLTPVTFQNDTYYTIKIGELIKNSGIDMMDHFSWHENLNYTYPHWLYDLLTYIIYSIGSFKGIYVTTCILSAILGISIFTVNTKLTQNKAISFIITIGSLYMLEDYITARAQLVTFILFIWELFCIEKFIQNKKIRYAIGLITISILIANLHTATWPFFFVLTLPYIAEYLISIYSDIILYRKIKTIILKIKIKILNKNIKNTEKIQKLEEQLEKIKKEASKIKIRREEENKNPYKIIINKNKNVKYLIIIIIICVLSGLLTPIGDTPYTYLYKTMQGNTTQNISEHLPMTLTNNTNVICTLIIFLAILIFTKTKIKLSDLFMLGGLCYLMLSTRRQVSMFVLICSVILTRLIIDLIKQYTEKSIEETEKALKHIGVIICLYK